jgi:predicted transcriptional regulator
MRNKHNRLPDLSGTQLEIMSIIWRKGKTTVREVWEDVSKERNVAYTTIMTLMSRLEEKGWLKHCIVGQTYVYSATRPKSETRANMISLVLDKVFGGAAEDLVTTLLAHKNISKKELEKVKEAIKKIEDKAKQS